MDAKHKKIAIGAGAGALVVAAAVATPLALVGGGGGPPPATANVFLDPAGSDTGANCTRYSTPQADPGGVVCSSFDRAYTLAQTGDTVLIRGGTFTTPQTIQVAHRKPDGASCNYLGDQSGCVTFQPEPGQSVTFDVPNQGGAGLTQLALTCITYIHLVDITFVDTTFVEAGTGNVLSNFAFGTNKGDSTCAAKGVGHDDIFEHLMVGGPAGIGSGGYNTCVVDTVATGTHDLPWAIGYAWNNGKGAYSHDNCLIGDTFQGYNFQNHGYPTHHMECVTWFSSQGTGGLSNTVIRDNEFLDCPVEGLFMQIDNPAVADGNLIEGNVFKGGPFPLKISCHSSGCRVTNTTVRFNTFQTGSNFSDCNGGCAWTGSRYYGNLTPACALSGWAGSHNVFSHASCATDDGTSTFGVVPVFVAAGAPSYDFALGGCGQSAADFVDAQAVAGYPATDITGRTRPQGNLDAGAFETCPASTPPPATTSPPPAPPPAPPASTTADTVRPTPPTGVQIQNGSMPSGVDLTWTAATDNVAVVGYRIYENAVELVDVPTTSATVPLAWGAHTLNVKAYDAAGNMSKSAVITVTSGWR